MTFSAPHYTEYASTAPNPPYNGAPVGCVVSATADVILAFTGKRTTDLSALGTAMGQKCRAHFGTQHGYWTKGYYWGPCCSYVELKARGIPVGYSRLTVSQLRAQAKAKHAVVIAGLYVSFPVVLSMSYNNLLPARGRSDLYTGAHGVVLWDFDGTHYYLSDADFGSPGRPVVPPYSFITASAVEGMYASRTWPATYTLNARSSAAAHFAATVSHPTNLWNDATKQWVYNGPNALTSIPGLVIRGAKYLKGGSVTYPITAPAKYAGYYIPIVNVKLGAIVP